uniref:Uncharacterized protein n=1 Tax=Arundo donax TaxID=35708 RepID=A0A0A9LYU8_ARUDO
MHDSGPHVLAIEAPDSFCQHARYKIMMHQRLIAVQHILAKIKRI